MDNSSVGVDRATHYVTRISGFKKEIVFIVVILILLRLEFHSHCVRFLVFAFQILRVESVQLERNVEQRQQKA